MLVVTAQEMAGLDRRTIDEIGIPGIVLMENAARGAAVFFMDFIPGLTEESITVVAGSGNNAGDGFALARIFQNRGAEVRVVCLKSPAQLSGDALTNFKIIDKLGIPILVWDEAADFDEQWSWVEESSAVIDAILGTGLKSEVTGLYRRVIETMNELPVPVLSLDVPSGLDASTGKPLGAAVMADATATFGFAKVGQIIEPGDQCVGELGIVDIGIPPEIAESSGIQRYCLTGDFVSRWVVPRHDGIHKGEAGHAGVLSGSRGKTGAAALVSLGAARVGAGLVTLFIPESLNPILEAKLTEPMTFPVAETAEHTPALAALAPILEFMEGKEVLAMGPGISTIEETGSLVRELVLKAKCPLVLDADAVTAVSQDPAILEKAAQIPVLTPHPGEMARLCNRPVSEIQEDRIGTASDFAKKHNCVLVLKGHRTIIAAPDGRVAINTTGNSAMACGGMGDVLTGMIAGFIAQGMGPFVASCLAVYVHGAAADEAIGEVASRGLLASDLLDEIPRVIGRIEGFEEEEEDE